MINKITLKINKNDQQNDLKPNKHGLKWLKIRKNDNFCVNLTAWQYSCFDFNCRRYPIIAYLISLFYHN